jgi:putative FmdB family regulatory protein
MPIYTYKADEGCEDCGGTQEITQSMSDENLTLCPFCPRKIHRVITLPMKTTSSRYDMSDSKIAKSGLTKYVNRGDGTYEKAAGPDEAPKVVSKTQLEKLQGG